MKSEVRVISWDPARYVRRSEPVVSLDKKLLRGHRATWARREWLAMAMMHTGALTAVGRKIWWPGTGRRHLPGYGLNAISPERAAIHAQRVDPNTIQTLARQAVEAAEAAGATYADARLTRIVQHHYNFGGRGDFGWDFEIVGCGVRALLGGCWGFAAAPIWQSDPQRQALVVQLAKDAVAQAKITAAATTRQVTLSPVVGATGEWSTPCVIDPFQVSIEEKCDAIAFWSRDAERHGVQIDPPSSYLHFARQERTVANSEGSLLTQTCYESGGQIMVSLAGDTFQKTQLPVRGLTASGQGWEIFRSVPEQLASMRELLEVRARESVTALPVGRYTIVCDGATTASLVGGTLGAATQLDRALGYEANAGGTSFLDDPLAMLGRTQVASPEVTVTANRSAPTQLATVRWDDEGVSPPDVTLVKDGVLHDFQTTREQAVWLAPYYTKIGRPVTSNGCAAAGDALHITMQMTPNLALVPSASGGALQDLISSVKDGLLLEEGAVRNVDFQARHGLLSASMRKISNGKLGRRVAGGAVQINTLDLWKNVKAVGNSSTMAIVASSQYDELFRFDLSGDPGKGTPPQRTSHSIQGVAALITDQPVINPSRKA